MAQTLASMLVQISADVSGFQQGVARAQSGLTSLSKATEGFGQTAKGLYVPTSALEGITPAAEKAAESVQKMGHHMHNAGPQIGGLIGKLTDMQTQMNLMFGGMTLSAAFTVPFVKIGQSALEATAKFEQAGNVFKVVTQASGADMERMRQLALDLGRDTVFSSNNAAQGMLEFGKAGLTAGQSMAAIRGTLNLAAAGGIEVGRAAEIAANALNAFKLPASEVTRIADLFAAAANASSVEIGDVTQSFQMAAAVFASAKIPVEDLTTAIAIMGNAGIKGSDAGTSLKQMFLALQAPSKEAQQVMASLGVKIYDVQGKMVPFRNVIGQFEASLRGASQQQRDYALATIFGSDAVRAANIMVGEGARTFDRMRESVTKAGAAQELSDARLKGLAGAVKYFQGSAESALIKVGTPWSDMLSRMVRGAADLISWFGQLPAPIQTTAAVLAGLAAAVGPVFLAISGVGAAALAISTGLPIVGAALSGLLGPWTALGVAIAGVAYLAYKNWGPIKDFFTNLWTTISTTTVNTWTSITNFLTAAWNKIGLVVEVAAGVIVGAMVPKLVLLGITATATAARTVAAWVSMGASAIANAAVHAVQTGIMVAKWAWLGIQSLAHAAKVAAAWFVALGPVGWVAGAIIGVVVLIAAKWDEIKLIFWKSVAAIMDAVRPLLKWLPDSWTEGFERMRKAAEENMAAAKKAVEDASARSAQAETEHVSILDRLTQAFHKTSQGAVKGFGDLRAALRGTEDQARVDFGNMGNYAGDLGNKVSGMAKKVTEKYTLMSDVAQEKYNLIIASQRLNEDSMIALRAKSTMLSEQFSAQSQKVNDLRAAYENMVAIKGAASTESQEFLLELLKEETAQAKLSAAIDKTAESLRGMTDSMKKAVEEANRLYQSRWSEAMTAVVKGRVSYQEARSWVASTLSASQKEAAWEGIKRDYYAADRETQSYMYRQQFGEEPPGLALGGSVLSPGSVLVGERGPEILNLPRGAQVAPLDRESGPVTIVIQLDGRTIAEETLPHIRRLISLRAGV